MTKYFGKCFGLSTPAHESSFWLRCPSFLLSKFASQLKLIQSVVRVRILGICITISVLRVLFSGFWVSMSQIFKSQGPISRVLGFRIPCPRVQESQGLGFQSPGSQSLRVGSWGSGSKVSGSQVPGLRPWF